MAGEDVRPDVVSQLEDALEAEEADEKDFHVRQALQLLEVDGEGGDERRRGDEEKETAEGENERDEAGKTGEESEPDEAGRPEKEENTEEGS